MGDTMRKMTLLIDDERPAMTDCIVRCYDLAMELLKLKVWRTVYIDHDLGGQKTGYDLLCWLEENKEYLPDRIICVSANPVGKEKMDKLIERLGCD
jgi:hypothetical protein